MGTKKQADAVAEGQLMAMFGETIESSQKIREDLKRERDEKKLKKLTDKKKDSDQK